MSCLTRKMQQNLIRYIKKRDVLFADKPVETVKNELVSMGLCPSDVTHDQMRDILRGACQR